MTEININNEDVEALAATLNGVDLSERERGVLEAIFALAGMSVASAATDVEGFAFDAFRQGGMSFSLNFNPVGDLHQAFGDGSVHVVHAPVPATWPRLKG